MSSPRHVRYSLESGYSSARFARPLCAKTGHDRTGRSDRVLWRAAIRYTMTDARARRVITLLTGMGCYRESSQGNILQPLTVPRASACGSKNNLSELPFDNADLMRGDCYSGDP